jgi:hypothetical protein
MAIDINSWLDSDDDEPVFKSKSVTKPAKLPGKAPSAGVQTGRGSSGRGPKKDLSVAHLIKYQPPDFVDSRSAGIKMGTSPAFSDEPLRGKKKIASKGPDNKRTGFSERSTLQVAHESPEVKKIRMAMIAGKKKAKGPVQKLPGVPRPI